LDRRLAGFAVPPFLTITINKIIIQFDFICHPLIEQILSYKDNILFHLILSYKDKILFHFQSKMKWSRDHMVVHDKIDVDL
jgi:hypothetical protein